MLPSAPDALNPPLDKRPETLLETIMRFTPATLALAALLTTVSSAGNGQRPDSSISPLSLEWQGRGDALRATGDLSQANDAYESALAADPRNRKAFIALAEVARAQGLQGKAIRFYNDALILDPADIDALGGQGQAMVEKGALSQANANLAKMKSLCRNNCPAIASLAGSIEARTRQAQLSANDGGSATTPSAPTPELKP